MEWMSGEERQQGKRWDKKGRDGMGWRSKAQGNQIRDKKGKEGKGQEGETGKGDQIKGKERTD